MGKCKLKGILTFLYSAIISVLFYLFLYIISLEIKINYKELFFLIGLVSLLIGIVVLISRNPIRMNGWGSSQSSSEGEFIDEDCNEVVFFIV
ncbi:MAG TPA: hypothetical protein VIK72_11540 [Clostridiaceae bacterium]